MIPQSFFPRLERMEEKLGVEFRDRLLLLSALTHCSYHHEHPDAFWDHNQRLEFLGDAVIEICVTEALFQMFPKKTEGELTINRAALVSTKALAVVGEPLGLPENLLFSAGERSTGLNDPKTRMRFTACAVEALIGAVHKDQGIGMSRMVVDHLILSRFDELVGLHADPKSTLQEIVQARHRVTPDYRLVSESGPDHAKRYRVVVFMGNIQLGVGRGMSKAEAEADAAADALTRIQPEVSHAS